MSYTKDWIMEQEHISDVLLKRINETFDEIYKNDPKIAKLLEKGKKATYKDAYKYAEQVGKARAQAYAEHISAATVPEGGMSYTTASKIMNGTLPSDHKMIANYAQNVQNNINEQNNIGLKAKRSALDEDKISGFVKRISSEGDIDSISWIFNEPIKTFARSIIDDSVKKNAEFQSSAGITAVVVRTAAFNCCPWCLDLAGEYTYPKVSGEVFQRHDNCRCTLDYAGKRLQAYVVEDNRSAFGVRDTHTFRDLDKLQERKLFAETKMSQIRRK